MASPALALGWLCENHAAYVVKEKGEIAAHCYHAGMTPKQRVRVQNDWRKGDVQVVVATIAFGMGAALPSYPILYITSASMLVRHQLQKFLKANVARILP